MTHRNFEENVFPAGKGEPLLPRISSRARKGLYSAALSALTVLGMAVAAPVGHAENPATGAVPIPEARGEQAVDSTITVEGTMDGELTRYYGKGDLGGGGQAEDQPPVFELEDGATLRNVIIGAPASDGIHCLGSCTLRNVWWEDVGEDAATLAAGSPSDLMVIDGGGARAAEDKVFQHNGPGTMLINDFRVEDFGTLYLSCGNCTAQYERHAIINDVTATAPGGKLTGVNVNYGDSVALSDITVVGDSEMDICVSYEGNETGAEPERIGSGPSKNCRYAPWDIDFE
ncbi:pectate lyase [Actinopolyspora alba]|nr:pectate lyase [Actinopolyspora alba]